MEPFAKCGKTAQMTSEHLSILQDTQDAHNGVHPITLVSDFPLVDFFDVVVKSLQA